MDELVFVPELGDLLQKSDVVVLTDDCSVQRASLAKAVRPRSPVRQRVAKRSSLSLQDEDFKRFAPNAIFISTSMVQSFNFSALASALRNQRISGAAFVIPLDGSMDTSDLQSLYHLDNVIAVPPPTTPDCAPKHHRRQLAAIVLQVLATGLGFPPLAPPELPAVPPALLNMLSSDSGTTTATRTPSTGVTFGRRLSGRIHGLLSEIIDALRRPQRRSSSTSGYGRSTSILSTG